jgi:aminoglycoside 6'-N-acetyltransferase I
VIAKRAILRCVNLRAARRILRGLSPRIMSMDSSKNHGATIRAARPGDEQELVAMQWQLWPEASADELRSEVEAAIGGLTPGVLPSVLLVAQSESGMVEDGAEGAGLAGWVLAGLRSHADGCDLAQPVGFIEGWFVREPFRGRGVGRALVNAAEAWARAQGCREMASDALIDNLPSQHAHQALGFEVVDRCVHFRKNL